MKPLGRSFSNPFSTQAQGRRPLQEDCLAMKLRVSSLSFKYPPMKTANFTFFVASLICLTSAAKAADSTLTFGVIAKSNNNPVFQVVRVSAEAEAKKLTAEKGVQVKI